MMLDMYSDSNIVGVSSNDDYEKSVVILTMMGII